MNIDQLKTWAGTHRKQLLIGGAAAAGGWALYQRHKASAGGLTNNNSGLSSSSVSPNVAGLSAAPPPDFTAGMSELSALEQLLNRRLPPTPTPTQPHRPTPPAPLPKPGHSQYTIRPDDTLAKISDAVYGEVTGPSIFRLKSRNPILMSFGRNASLRFFAGYRLSIPPAPAATRKDPKPRPVHPPKKDKQPRPVKKPAPAPRPRRHRQGR